MPTSYQGAMRRDSESKTRTVSQSSASNVATAGATVQNLLDGKPTDIFAVQPEDTLLKAVTLLRDKKIGALLVTDGSGALLGILSERDIVRKLADTPGQTLPQSVADNMTADVVSCAPGDDLVTVLRRMSEGRFRHMPVVIDGKVAGMISIGDLVSYRLKELEHEALQLKQMVVG